MHKVANENPGERIIFDFYDDQENILRALQSFFEIHNESIPIGMTLRLNQYALQNLTLKTMIDGSGMIDRNYRNTIREMAKLVFSEH